MTTATTTPSSFSTFCLSGLRRWTTQLVWLAWVLLNLTLSQTAHAVPAFARQTGANCMACHAGGQYPELTSYGRLFKLTGYTMGESGNPLSAMLVGSQTRTQNNNDGAGGIYSPLDGQSIIDFGSIFLAGKATDHVGGFAQFTYSAYDSQNPNGSWNGHWGSDNFDLRYADRKDIDQKDLVWGLTLHNNPTVQDVWNSTPAWGYPYVSTTQGAFGGLPASTLVEGALAQHVAGLGGYLYWDNTLYAELTSYQTAKGPWGFLSMGNQPGNLAHPLTHLDQNALYWRLAYTRQSNVHNVMVGAFGMDSKVLPNDATTADPLYGAGSTHYQDFGIDAQYQYLQAAHTFTMQWRSVQEHINDGTGMTYAGPAALNTLRAKASYVYRATYGTSLSYTSVSGSPDAMAYGGSLQGIPDTDLWTPELFWLPMQNLRLGLQFNKFTKYLGASTNYDAAGRNASDNDTTYLYLWAAF